MIRGSACLMANHVMMETGGSVFTADEGFEVADGASGVVSWCRVNTTHPSGYCMPIHQRTAEDASLAPARGCIKVRSYTVQGTRLLLGAATLLCMLAAAGCRDFSVDHGPPGGTSADRVVAAGTPFELGYGQRVIVDGADLAIEFTTVMEDDRCLRTVQCVQAGRAGILLTIIDNQSERSQIVVQIPGLVATPYVVNDIIQFNGYRYQLLQVDPYPEENTERRASAYSILLAVEPVVAP